jgi:hypothetical protein
MDLKSFYTISSVIIALVKSLIGDAMLRLVAAYLGIVARQLDDKDHRGMILKQGGLYCIIE